MGKSHVPGSRCVVCDNVATNDRLELDLLMADPSRWPAAVWEQWDKPRGLDIPPSMRLWGAVRLGQQWLIEHGYPDIGKAGITTHYNRHVPLLPTNPAELIEAGVMAEGGTMIPSPRLNPLAYLEFYSKGIEAGKKGIDLLMGHVAKLEKDGEPVPLALIKTLIDVGGKLAVSQAAIKSREPSQPTLDDDEDFRIGAPGPKIGHGRVRIVEGETRFVHDDGPQDRARYNARVRQEAGAEL